MFDAVGPRRFYRRKGHGTVALDPFGIAAQRAQRADEPGRFSGFGQPMNWIAADIVHVKKGVLIEHWDVIEDEATQE